MDTDWVSLAMSRFAPPVRTRRRGGGESAVRERGVRTRSRAGESALKFLLILLYLPWGYRVLLPFAAFRGLPGVFVTLRFIPTHPHASSQGDSASDSASAHAASQAQPSSSTHLAGGTQGQGAGAHPKTTHNAARLRTSRTDRRGLAARAQGGDTGAVMGTEWGCEVIGGSLFLSGGECFDLSFIQPMLLLLGCNASIFTRIGAGTHLFLSLFLSFIAVWHFGLRCLSLFSDFILCMPLACPSLLLSHRSPL
jgi:hypothetical protein